MMLTAAVYSEVSGVWYCEDPYRPCNFFALDRSSVTVIDYTSPPTGLFSGIPLYEQGWSTHGATIRAFTHREWLPAVRVDQAAGSRYALVRLPLWMPALAFGGLAWWGWRVGPRHGPGRCGACGYDVRGVVGGLCPECGRSVAPPAIG